MRLATLCPSDLRDSPTLYPKWIGTMDPVVQLDVGTGQQKVVGHSGRFFFRDINRSIVG